MPETYAPSFSFQALGLGAVLKLNRLAVPVYQREYSWTEEKVEQLLRDLQTARDDSTDYFLGTVVTIPKPGNSDVLEVVDGQQRLTTTALFLSCIRDYIRDIDSQNLIVESIENEFLTTIDRRQARRVPRLQLNVDDHTFFENLVNAGNAPVAPTRASHRRLLSAHTYIKGFIRRLVSTYEQANSIQLLNEWIGFIENRASVILLKAPDGSHAFRMFETLNDRGQKVSQADLVKNYLFEQAGTSRIIEAQARWSSMLSTLEEVDDEDRHINFLRHVLIATRAFTRADRVFSTVQNRVRGEADSVQLLSDLERLAGVYVATYRPDSDRWNGYPTAALKAIKVLALLDLKPFRPLILSIVEKFEASEAAKALALFVSVGVRILIASRTNSGQIEQNCAQTALATYRGEITKTQDLRDRLDPIIPGDADFEEAFRTTASSKPQLARYYLRSLEQALAQDPEPYFDLNDDPDAITLEHVLPKKVEGNWPHISDEDVKRYSRRLGNLCLLQRTPNSDLRSAAFSVKRPILNAASYALTSEIGKFDQWSAVEIETRQERLAELSVKAWPVGRARTPI
jgi:hypothetical protein